MKSIIKTILVAAALLMGFDSYAQIEMEDSPAPKKVTFGIRGGLNISNLTAYHDGDTYREKVRVGFNVGAIVDFHLGKDFYLRSGLGLTSKGAKVKDIIEEDGTYDCNMNAMYLQVPLYFAYKIPVAFNANKVSLAIGPYFGYGIAGKSKFETKTGSKVDEIDTFDDDWMWNKPDVGLGLEVGFELPKVSFTFGAEMSFTKTWKREFLTEDINVHNQVSYISVGYNF